MEIIKVLLDDLDGKIFYRKNSKTDLFIINEILFKNSLSLDFLKISSSIRVYYDIILSQGFTPLIIDAGANIGAASISFLSTYRKAKILAIEPEEGNLDLLNLNLQSLNASIVPGAIASESGTLFLHDPGSGDWGFRVSEHKSGYAVKAHSINDLLKGSLEHDETPFICKIDIEGGEQDLFCKNTEWMAKFPVIMIEIHDWMLPRKSISKNLFAAIGLGNFDVVISGELLIILNNNLLE